MSAAPTDKPEPEPDPWQVPASVAAPAAKKAATAKTTAARTATGTAQRVPAKKAARPAPTTANRQQARQELLQKNRARMMARMTWPMVVRWILASVVLRVLAAVALVLFGLEYAHLHSVAVAPTTTAEQWNDAVQSADHVYLFNFVLLIAMVLPSQAWMRARAYVAKLPGVAPHPLQSSKPLYRTLQIPSYWPPVPEGTPSWTRRVHWRVPLALEAGFLAVFLGGTLFGHVLVSNLPGRYQYSAVIDLVAAVLALLCSALDLIRLRAYSRWPGRP
ncbi:hypothetical protein KDL01_18860 [Actinospica durhamensis]|uniref:Uncharacterized protein n=1 Tax=Actinospica durhamensis TaxID=1508375 RepID=A0A941ERV2_9ACTN|nr:hypothetical protein [Actinospica durhamensis]MBR7835342.1 hypothetical protein [Actinospica durhamensis]